MSGALPRWSAWARAAFVSYGVVLATLTHWPRLSIDGPEGLRLDLFIHMGAFGTWVILLSLCAWFGPALAGRNIARCAGIGVAYALLDELTQGIPVFGRTVDALDLLANSLGIVVATLCLWWLAAGRARTPDAR